MRLLIGFKNLYICVAVKKAVWTQNKSIAKGNNQNIKQIQAKTNKRHSKNLNYKKPFQIFFKFANNKIVFASCIYLLAKLGILIP